MIRVLLVEDNADDAVLLRAMLGKEPPGSFELTHMARMSEAVAHLERGGVDVVLLDMSLPDGQGIENLRRTRAVAPDVALIVLTGLDDAELGAQTIKEGAQDYLMKGEIENRALPRTLRHVIGLHRMQQETGNIRSQQSQLRDEFLSHVSHHLQSPLTSIHSLTAMVANGPSGETSPEQDSYLQIVMRNVRQLQSMMEDLLEVTQAQAGKLSVQPQALAIEDAIASAVALLQRVADEKGVTLSFRSNPGLPQVYADAARVLQISMILLDNAVKFTQAGGLVHAQVSVYEKDQGYLLVEVSDTGCGIGAEATTRIFEPLFQIMDPAMEFAPDADTDAGRTARRGLGVGLHIGRELVSRMGGELWVESEPQKGSHFFFTLPKFSRPISTSLSLPQEHLHMDLIVAGRQTRLSGAELPGRG